MEAVHGVEIEYNQQVQGSVTEYRRASIGLHTDDSRTVALHGTDYDRILGRDREGLIRRSGGQGESETKRSDTLWRLVHGVVN